MAELRVNSPQGPQRESLKETARIVLPSRNVFAKECLPSVQSTSEKLYLEMLPKVEQSYEERFTRLDNFSQKLTSLQTKRIDSRWGGNHIGSQVDLLRLSPDIPVIIVGDLHGEVDNLKRILLDRNNLDRISKGEAVLLLLGDLVHPENGDLTQMTSSVQLHELYMNLKIKYPHHIFSLTGNHDPINEWTFKKLKEQEAEPILQSELHKKYICDILIRAGANNVQVGKYLSIYSEQTEQSALFAIGEGFAAVHAGPIKNLSLEQMRAQKPIDNEADFEDMRVTSKLREPAGGFWADEPLISAERELAYTSACWSRYAEVANDRDGNDNIVYNWNDVESFMVKCKQNEGVLLAGHCPPKDYRQWNEEIKTEQHNHGSETKTKHYVLTASRSHALGYAVMKGGAIGFYSI